MKHIKLCMVALCCLVTSIAYATCSPINVSYLTPTSGGIAPMTTDDSQIWSWYASYTCGYGTAYGKSKEVGYQAHLFTPSLDLSETKNVTITFQHAHKFGDASAVQTDFTLWVTKDYQGSYDASSWQQLTIPVYGTNNDWKYVEASISVPNSYVGNNTVFAFKYNNGSATGTWQVKNINIIATCADGAIASPIPLPDLGNGRIRVFAQNLENYYFNYNTGRGKYAGSVAQKTKKLVDVLMMVNADIFAFCEVEAQPIVLQQLADSMNARVEGSPYINVTPDLANEEWSEQYDNNLKSGFIYNSKTVKPYGNNYAASTANYYKNTQRIQAFEEIASKERFTLTMNHFRAKTSDDSESTRIMNANHLVSALNSYAQDPDILIMGDLNCEKGEQPITILENAGYEEQLLKYDASAYSHCYNNAGNLIDHAMANSSMAAMITGAGVFHICTTCGEDASANINYRYSDHDACMVAFNLPMKIPGQCEDINETMITTGGSSYSPMTAEKISGGYNWQYKANYGATCQNKGGENWLLTPEYDLSNSKDIQISFQHTVGYANEANMANEQTLWVTKNFQGSVAASEWTKLIIPTYPTIDKNWPDYVTATVSVPENVVGQNTVFAFKYKVESGANSSPTWEIKNLNIQATCKGGTTDIETLPVEQRAQKTIENGKLYITLPDGSKYNVVGIRVR